MGCIMEVISCRERRVEWVGMVQGVGMVEGFENTRYQGTQLRVRSFRAEANDYSPFTTYDSK